ncbi:AAA family ATPase [Ruminococcus sp. XPD3002]|uniref:AAA family ATPase n=1 Tax=Ruminococcus sp. XPD3002 TaxID=1452269 RepID=UPI00091BA5EE|nr:AAA+-type ATPase, SpoVK/Ycf46/Vps4 family [Ruminococcus flavefaciens]
MPEFKCISCGNSVEHEKQCTCPHCGYTMYELPYDRAVLLRNEIIRFVMTVSGQPADIKLLIWGTKAKDDKRFPDFGKIQAYACTAQKTELFLSRVRESIEKIRQHIHTPFQKKYRAETKFLQEWSDDVKDQLAEAAAALSVECELPELLLPEMMLHHTETPDMELVGLADLVLDKAEQLADKIQKFIKLNSIYGRSFSKTKNPPKTSDHWAQELQKRSEKLDKILQKKYVVDILDDGTKELQEMLQALWDSIYTVMSLPILTLEDNYDIGEAISLSKEAFAEKLTALITARFSDIRRLVNETAFLSEYDEDKLFELYNAMLDLDTDGCMKLQKGITMKTGSSEQQLNALIGLDSVKESIRKLKAFALVNKGNTDFNLHMTFCGNPGTGKTEVARIIAGILHENGLLPTAKVVETDRSGLVAAYVGQTSLKTMERIEEAMGGVLFIDEAYALTQGESKGDYGHEAVATLIKAMEDYRGKFCVILAGYRNPIQAMIASNPGFRSRIQFHIDFPNYARNELGKIAALMLKNKDYTISEEALERILDITDIKRKEPDFANAREIRNILDQVMICQNLRCMDAEDKKLEIVDVNKYIKDAHLNLPTSGDGVVKKIMTAEDELDALVGLSAVKRMVKKIKAYAKRNKGDPDFNLHMCFYGNPGTGKTEVARLLSSILNEAGVLPEAKLTETDANGLIGKYVGETAPKTLAKINDAMGGVLFIDEAYSLTETTGSDGHSAGYGDEAIAVLLKEMEDRRGQFCVILAGYRENMESMLNSNPGMKSRIQFQLDFPDYIREELGDIAAAFLVKKKYEITDDALQLVLDVTEYYRNRPNFANARTIRNILDQVIMNQNLRTEDEPDNTIVRSDVQDYIDDENINLSDTSGGKRKIGF